MTGVFTQVRCDCKGERSPWMQLIEANPKMPPHYVTTCTLEEQEVRSKDASATTLLADEGTDAMGKDAIVKEPADETHSKESPAPPSHGKKDQRAS